MMHTPLDYLLRLHIAISMPRRRDERGDVPGWVMVTLMTVGIVLAIWGVAQERLSEMLDAALGKVGTKANGN